MVKIPRMFDVIDVVIPNVPWISFRYRLPIPASVVKLGQVDIVTSASTMSGPPSNEVSLSHLIMSKRPVTVLGKFSRSVKKSSTSAMVRLPLTFLY